MSIDRKIELQEHDLKKSDTHKQTALLETLVIVLIGLSVGATGYLGTTKQVGSVTNADAHFFQNIAVALYRFVSGNEATIVRETNSLPESVSATISLQSARESETKQSFVIAPVEKFPANTVDALRDSFSDEVEIVVDPEYADTGIVVPKFKDTKGEPYRFLMVPVDQQVGS